LPEITDFLSCVWPKRFVPNNKREEIINIEIAGSFILMVLGEQLRQK